MNLKWFQERATLKNGEPSRTKVMNVKLMALPGGGVLTTNWREFFDGLYVRHRPEDHDKWKNCKNKRAEKQKESKETKQKSRYQNPSISDKLKSKLMTKCELSESEIDDLVSGSK